MLLLLGHFATVASHYGLTIFDSSATWSVSLPVYCAARLQRRLTQIFVRPRCMQVQDALEVLAGVKLQVQHQMMKELVHCRLHAEQSNEQAGKQAGKCARRLGSTKHLLLISII